jgi:alanine racemase
MIGEGRTLMPVVKSNAYGHGHELVVRALAEEGADWFGVNSLDEALETRRLAPESRILVLGYVDPGEFREAVEAGLDLTLTNPSDIPLLDRAARAAGVEGRLHLKVETGTHRRGVPEAEFEEAAAAVREASPSLRCVGLSTHFANIEDTVDHSYAEEQLRRFGEAERNLGDLGLRFEMRHTACTAATLLFPDTHFDLARVGIGLYGLWPSRETRLSFRMQERNEVELRPCLTWKARLTQVKTVPAGSDIGYGRTYRTGSESRIGVLSVGYHEGYDRRFSSVAHVLRWATTRGTTAASPAWPTSSWEGAGRPCGAGSA